ncbi:NAD(+)--dinitrogen-reductase ADP-D-ribosyltransferase [Kaarinaea lacus]
MQSSLPANAKTTINRCNLPVQVLGDVSFQTTPKPIAIDGVAQLHKRFFQDLVNEPDTESRSQMFLQYMRAHFTLDSLDDAGYEINIAIDRSRANYLRVLRGWFFDADSQEGAVIKAWVESRFGLIPRYHQRPIRSIDDDAYLQYVSKSSRGLYNTNALESQLDLLYSYCQFELSQRFPSENHFVLYRGQNGVQSLEQLAQLNTPNKGQTSLTLLLNNISSFTSNTERAGEFGDIVLRVAVPFPKLLFFSGLMPGVMTSEEEYAVIGGVYNVDLVNEFNRDM